MEREVTMQEIVKLVKDQEGDFMPRNFLFCICRIRKTFPQEHDAAVFDTTSCPSVP